MIYIIINLKFICLYNIILLIIFHHNNICFTGIHINVQHALVTYSTTISLKCPCDEVKFPGSLYNRHRGVFLWLQGLDADI